MASISEYIKSGIIETYVLGLCTPDEQLEIESLATVHPEVRNAIDEFSESLEQQALTGGEPVNPLVKPMFMATIDFMARMEAGEKPSNPPALNEQSTIADYREWLDRPDMKLPEKAEDIYVRLISASPKLTTAIVWIKEATPPEVHDDEFEKFLVVEGTCIITIGNDEHHLQPGDFLAIPLHLKHGVAVTPNIYCKVILQRAAA